MVAECKFTETLRVPRVDRVLEGLRTYSSHDNNCVRMNGVEKSNSMCLEIEKYADWALLKIRKKNRGLVSLAGDSGSWFSMFSDYRINIPSDIRISMGVSMRRYQIILHASNGDQENEWFAFKSSTATGENFTMHRCQSIIRFFGFGYMMKNEKALEKLWKTEEGES